MIKENIFIKQEWIVSSVLFFVIIIFIFVVFFSFIFYKNKSKKIFKFSSNKTSEIKINIKEKLVYVNDIKNNLTKKQNIYDLDDYIYMISLNHDSKNFREMLKLINNDRPIQVIIKKIKTLSNTISFIINYGSNVTSFAIARIETNDYNGENIYIQLEEMFITTNKKDEFLNLLDDEIITYNEKELFSLISKDIKNLKQKGWTLLKINFKDKILPTDKEYNLLLIQFQKIALLLKDKYYSFYLSKDGSLFILSKINKKNEWNIMINNILFNKNQKNILFNKNQKNVFDFNKNDLKISIISEFIKDLKVINTTLIKLKLLNELSENEKNKESINDIFKKAEKINEQSLDLYKKIKENNSNLIIFEEYLTKTRGIKSIIEFNFNLSIDKLKLIMKYSYRYKYEILEFLIKTSNNKSKNFPNKISFINLRISEIEMLKDIFINVKRNKKFYIGLERNYDDINNSKLIDLYKLLNKTKYKFIYFASKNEKSINILCIFKPKYIIFNKYDDKNYKYNQEFFINLNKIKLIKENSTKIIELN